jgi:hypothetical protein
MKPPYEKFTKWLEKAGQPFVTALEEELKQMTARTSERLEPSAAWIVAQRLFFEASRTAVIKADQRLKSSKGGAEGAKTRKDDADARHAEARQMIAKKLEKLALNRRKQSKRGIALEIRPRLKPPLSRSTIERLIDDERAKREAAKIVRHVPPT